MLLLPLGLLAPAAQAGPMLLDGLANPAILALSTRKLRAAYAGPCLRVRRSSDNAEQDIGFTAAGNLDTEALLTFCGASNSGFVAAWFDQGGQGQHAVQATPSLQPRIVSPGAVRRFLPGRPPAPEWLPASCVLAGALALGGAAVQAVCAATDISTTPNARLLSYTAAGDAADNATPASAALLYDADPDFDFFPATARGGAALASTAALGPGARCFAVAYDGSTAALWVNGAAAGSTASAGAFGAAGTLRVGNGPGGQNWTGAIGEAVVQAVASPADRAAIEASQKLYWGTP